MKSPKKRPNAFRVRSTAGLVDVVIHPALKNGKLLGRASMRHRRIEMTARQASITLEHTLWHEWLHFVFNDSGVKMSEEEEEHVVDVVASALCNAKLILPAE